MTTRDSISVAWRDRPFDGAFHHAKIPFRGRPPTIAETLSQVPGLPDVFRDVGDVRLNGDLIPREWWDRVRPRSDRDSAITLHMPLRGGGSSSGGNRQGKSTAATVATIAVLVAATAVSGGLAAPLIAAAGITGTAATLAGSIAGAAIGIGGDLYIGDTL